MITTSKSPPYYHVRVTVSGQKHDEVKTDVDEGTLEQQFLAPYRTGQPITMNGKVIAMDRLERIRVSTSGQSAEAIIPAIKAEDAQSRVVRAGGPSYAWRAAARARDVTDQFITSPPGGEVARVPAAASNTNALHGPGDRKSVFVVSGRDSEATSAVIALLRAVGLTVVEWEHAVARTGLPNPYIGDVVKSGLEMADAVLVLFTGDDVVHLRQDLLRDDDEHDEREPRGQARPNVFYEAGIADALGRDRTVLVEVGRVKSFSDAAGRYAVRYDGSASKRNTLVERLRLAGLAPDTSGSDWLSVGDISGALDKARDALAAEQGTSPTSH